MPIVKRNIEKGHRCCELQVVCLFIDFKPWAAKLFVELPQVKVLLYGQLRQAEILAKYSERKSPSKLVQPGV